MQRCRGDDDSKDSKKEKGMTVIEYSSPFIPYQTPLRETRHRRHGRRHHLFSPLKAVVNPFWCIVWNLVSLSFDGLNDTSGVSCVVNRVGL